MSFVLIENLKLPSIEIVPASIPSQPVSPCCGLMFVSEPCSLPCWPCLPATQEAQDTWCLISEPWLFSLLIPRIVLLKSSAFLLNTLPPASRSASVADLSPGCLAFLVLGSIPPAGLSLGLEWLFLLPILNLKPG